MMVKHQHAQSTMTVIPGQSEEEDNNAATLEEEKKSP